MLRAAQTSALPRDKNLTGTFRQRAAISAAALPLHVHVALCGFTADVVVRPEMHMHNINKMVYVGIEPWHGLGVRLPANATYRQIAELAGFYNAEEKQLFIEGSNLVVPDKKAVVRGDDGRYLATVGSGYSPPCQRSSALSSPLPSTPAVARASCSTYGSPTST